MIVRLLVQYQKCMISSFFKRYIKNQSKTIASFYNTQLSWYFLILGVIYLLELILNYNITWFSNYNSKHTTWHLVNYLVKYNVKVRQKKKMIWKYKRYKLPISHNTKMAFPTVIVKYHLYGLYFFANQFFFFFHYIVVHTHYNNNNLHNNIIWFHF